MLNPAAYLQGIVTKALFSARHPAMPSPEPPPFRFHELPQELARKVVEELGNDKDAIHTLHTLRLVSHDMAMLVETCRPELVPNLLLRQALLSDYLGPGVPQSARFAKRLAHSIAKSSRLEVKVPSFAEVFFYEQSRVIAFKWNSPNLGLRMLRILAVAKPVLGELTHVALQFEDALYINDERDERSRRRYDVAFAAEEWMKQLFATRRERLRSLALQNEFGTEGSWVNRLSCDCPGLLRLELSMRICWADVVQPLAPSIRELELSNCNIDDEALARLVPLLPPGLRYLGLGYGRLSQPAPLQDCASLESLALTLSDEQHTAEKRTQLSCLPPHLKHLTFINDPLPHVVQRALALSSCAGALESLSFVSLVPHPLGAPRRPHRKHGAEGGTPYVLLDLCPLQKLKHVTVPYESARFGITCAVASPNAHMMQLRHAQQSIASNGADASPDHRIGEMREPTWIFVRKDTGEEDIWPPQRRATDAELAPKMTGGSGTRDA